MEEEKINLLVSEDELMPDDGNITNYEIEPEIEEIDFSDLGQENTWKDSYDTQEETIQSVPLEPVYEDVPLNEHPSAKITLQKDETMNNEEESTVTVDLKETVLGNKTLLYVLSLGVIILLAIFIVPYFI